MPNIEWSAAWTAGPGIPKTMPHEIYEKLSDYGKHICRFVHAEPGVWPVGAGVMHPLGHGRAEAFRMMAEMTDGDTGGVRPDGGLGQPAKPRGPDTGKARL